MAPRALHGRRWRARADLRDAAQGAYALPATVLLSEAGVTGRIADHGLRLGTVLGGPVLGYRYDAGGGLLVGVDGGWVHGSPFGSGKVGWRF